MTGGTLKRAGSAESLLSCNQENLLNERMYPSKLLTPMLVTTTTSIARSNHVYVPDSYIKESHTVDSHCVYM